MGRGKRHNAAGTAPRQVASSAATGLDLSGAALKRLDNPPHSGIARDPSLIILAGVSGGGKDTLIKAASEAHELRKPISATSRAPRTGEADGVDYHFLTREQFEARVAAGDMYESEEFNGNYYGTLLSELEGDDLKLAIRENKGAKNMKERLGCIVVGVLPPSADAVRERMLARGDDPAEVESRLAVDKDRTEEILGFADYIIVNDDLDEATNAFNGLIDELAVPAPQTA